MQTFLPYESYEESARCLDRQRLGKQRVETLQILNTLTGRSTGWAQHPAVKMWRGYEYELAEYGIAICREWISRGYKDTCLGKIQAIQDEIVGDALGRVYERPWWLGFADLHKSHRAALLYKDFGHYQSYFDASPTDAVYDYYWPSVPPIAVGGD